MPLYEYRCDDCQKVSEFRMKMSDPHPETCPHCGHSALTKLISAAAFHLKGGGWYSQSYDGKSNAKKDNKEAASKGEKGTEPKAETASKGNDSKSTNEASSSKESTKAPEKTS